MILSGLVAFRYFTVIKKQNPEDAFCCSPWLPWCPTDKKKKKNPVRRYSLND